MNAKSGAAVLRLEVLAWQPLGMVGKQENSIQSVFGQVFAVGIAVVGVGDVYNCQLFSCFFLIGVVQPFAVWQSGIIGLRRNFYTLSETVHQPKTECGIEFG